MELTVGPNQFFWKKEDWSHLCENLAAAPVERVVLGELVCSKRLPFYQDAILPAVEELLKQVAHSAPDDIFGFVHHLTELRRREFYEKPTQERKRKKAAAVKRHLKRVSREAARRKRLY